MPRAVRTNNSSFNRVRKRFKALLTAGCDRPSLSAVVDTRRSISN